MNKTISLPFLLALLSVCFQSQAQIETKTIKRKTDHTIEEIEVLKHDKSVFHGSYKKMTRGRLLLEKGFYKNNKKDSVWIYYSKSKPKQSGTYKEGEKVGVWKYFNHKGELEQEFDVTKQELVSSSDQIYNTKCDILIGKEFAEKVVDRKPMVVGGYSSIIKNIRYPREAIRNGLSGKVIIGFEIDEFGKPSNFRVEQSAGKVLDNAVLKELKSVSHKWVPAIYNQKAITSRISFPFVFEMI